MKKKIQWVPGLRKQPTFRDTTVHWFARGIDLFHNGGPLIYSFIYMIIGLFDLVSMCKIQKDSYFKTRSERLIIIYIKEYINGPPL